MRSKTWEATWRERRSHELWSVPDAEVVALIETLRGEGVRRALDLGFGLGRHVILLAREGFDTYGIEPTMSGFAYCEGWLEAEGLHADIRIGDMKELPYEDGFFDFVLSWNVIYHGTFLQLKRALEEISRVTRRYGLVYLTLNSTRNKHYGHGAEIEPNTFLNPMKADGDLPHHYSDEDEVRALFEDWDVLYRKEQEESLAGLLDPGSYHWMILARKT
ncbi:MAG: class I SAM-dependent methyltransferase [Candidatus Bathyarchaeota archaeon]|nr:class I SAM-dependent methyltransferase [Candidatus Bathyarchaeota archaeon]